MTNPSLCELVSSSGLSNEQTARVLRVLEEYLAELERGGRPHPEELMARHPDLAELLKEYLDRLDLLHEAAVRFRVAEPPTGVAADAAENDLGRLGDFQLLREIGRGGMGIVYEAEQISLNRRVALKVLPFAATMDARQLQRFQNEARAAAGLHHTNIVPIYYVGSERRVYYYAMQFIEGRDLASLVTQLREQAGHKIPEPEAAKTVDATDGGAVAPAALPAADTRPIAGLSTERSTKSREYFHTVARLGIQAAEALDHAHQMGIVHRDVKPANLLVDAAGRLWVTDFGLAQIQSDTRLTMTGDLVGTLRYMSPEQALAKRVIVDHRTDIYSLGATLYELLTLEPAFDGRDRQELLRQIAFDEPRPPRRVNKTIPAELETIVLKALAKEPAERYATAQELADDLRNFLEDRAILARRPSMRQRLWKLARRHPTTVRAVAALVLVTAAVLAWVTADAVLRRERTEQAAAQALAEADRCQQRGQLLGALAAAQQAEAAVLGGSPSDGLRQRVRRRRADLELVAELEEARHQIATGAQDDQFDFALGDRMYREAFQRAQIDVERLSAEEVAAQIRQSTVAAELAGELDLWAVTRWHTRQAGDDSGRHLLRAASLADPDKRRESLRQALASGERERLLGVARSEDVLDLPSASLITLAWALELTGGGEQAIALLRAAQQRHPDEFWLNADLGRMLLAQPGRAEEAVRFFTAAVALRPQSAGVHNNLGTALHRKGDPEGAFREFQTALRINPNFAMAHYNLGVSLKGKEDSDGAIREFRAALLINPNYPDAHCTLGKVLYYRKGDHEGAIREYQAELQINHQHPQAHYWLGLALKDKGDLDGAIREYQAARQLDPQLLGAHINLGYAFRQQGRFAEALHAFQTAHTLASERKDGIERIAPLVRETEHLIELDAQLPRILNGEPAPADSQDRRRLAWICQQPYKRLYAASARFYAEAFAAEPKLAEDLSQGHRYNAACAAALAGCGQGKDADHLDAQEGARLRQQARDWLRADLTAWRNLLEKDKDKAAPVVGQQMQHWLGDPDFNGVRGTEALAKLPEAERGDWQRLWEEVAALRQRTQPKEK